MLGKLLKYDFRSMGKQFALIWPAALVIGLVNRFTLFGSGFEERSMGVIGMTALLLLIAVLVAMGVISLVFILQRFYKGLLGDEGYLMHTLPVRPWQLVTSKLICALVVTIVSSVVAVLAMVVMMPIDWSEFFQSEFWMVLSRMIAEHMTDVVYMVEFGILALVSLISAVLELYGSMAIGHLFQKHRVAMSVAAFILINIVLSNLMSLLGETGLMNGSGHGQIWLSIALEAALGAAFFAGTNRILGKKLNLE